MANETQQWAAVQLARIRRDSGEYEYQRSKARAQQDVEFTKGLAATAREGKLMASPGIRAAELAGIPLGFMGPIGAGISTVGYGALGAARVGEGLQRRAEGLPYGSEIGWGLADVAMPFVGPAYRAIKGRIPKKGVPEMLRRPLPEPVGSDPVRLRMPEGETLLTPEQQKIHQQNVAKGLKELDSRKERKAFGKDMGLEVDALPQGPAPRTVFRGRLLGATPPQRTHAPVTMTTEGPALLTRGGLKPKINLADPQSWTHLPGELPPIPRPATPRFAAGRQLPKYFDEPARVDPAIPIAKGPEGLNVDRPRGYIPLQPDDLTKTGAARTAILPPRDPAGLKQWDTVKEPLTTQGGKIPSDLQRLGPDHSARQQLGGEPVAVGAKQLKDERKAAEQFGSIDDAYEAVERAKVSPQAAVALPTATRNLQGLLNQKYVWVEYPADVTKDGLDIAGWKGWVTRASAHLGSPADPTIAGGKKAAVPFRRAISPDIGPGVVGRAARLASFFGEGSTEFYKAPRRYITDPFEYYGVPSPRTGGSPGSRPLPGSSPSGSAAGGGVPQDTSRAIDDLLNKVDDAAPKVDDAVPTPQPTPDSQRIPPTARVARILNRQLTALLKQKEQLVDDIRQGTARDLKAWSYRAGDPLPQPMLTAQEMKLHRQKIQALEKREAALRERLRGRPPRVSPQGYDQLEKKLEALLAKRKNIRQGAQADPTAMHRQMDENEQAIRNLVTQLQKLGRTVPSADALLWKTPSTRTPGQLDLVARLRNSAAKATQPAGQPRVNLADDAFNMTDKEADKLLLDAIECLNLGKRLRKKT